MAPSIFAKFIFNIYPFRKLDPSSSNGLKVQNFEDPIEGDPQPGVPDLCLTKVLPDIFNRSNFEYRAFSGLKIDRRGRKRKKFKKRC